MNYLSFFSTTYNQFYLLYNNLGSTNHKILGKEIKFYYEGNCINR